MNPLDNPPGQAPAADQTRQMYYVVAVDMATYDSHAATIESYQAVLASAEDEYRACDAARGALEDGMIPIAAFDRTELLAMVEALASQPLRPGEVYNLSHQMTGAEMRAWLDED